MSELAVGSLAGLAANSYVIDVASGSQLTQPGMVLQVVQAVKTDTFSTSSTSYTDITGLSASITPTSTSSKILVIVDVGVSAGATGDTYGSVRLLRDATPVYVGDTAGSRAPALFQFFDNSSEMRINQAVLRQGGTFLDSPASVSSLTYKAQMKVNANTGYVNRTFSDTDLAYYVRTASSITVMEIAG